jgi:hypothetical protein
MTAPASSAHGDQRWPTDKQNALRLGQRLITEVQGAGPGRRAFVDISPASTLSDSQARLQGWRPSDGSRAFRLQHWDYDAARIDGFDYDIDANLINDATAADEQELLAVLAAWRLRPEQFLYPWQTDDPR